MSLPIQSLMQSLRSGIQTLLESAGHTLLSYCATALVALLMRSLREAAAEPSAEAGDGASLSGAGTALGTALLSTEPAEGGETSVRVGAGVTCVRRSLTAEALSPPAHAGVCKVTYNPR